MANNIIERLRSMVHADDIDQIEIEIAAAAAHLKQLTMLRDLLFPPGGAVQPTTKTPDQPVIVWEPPPATNGKPEKADPQEKPKQEPRTKTAGNEPLAERLGTFLRTEGPRRRDAIRNALGLTDAQINQMIDHPWFEKDGVRIGLSSDGHVEFANPG